MRRVWSAWVSKILLRDPRFVRRYGAEPWFPEPPRIPEDIIRSFRAFVAALPDRAAGWHDPHWMSQVELAGTDVFRTTWLRVWSGSRTISGTLHGIYDATDGTRSDSAARTDRCFRSPPSCSTPRAGRSARRLQHVTDAFGYAVSESTVGLPLDAWVAMAEARLPGIHAVIERNERIGDLKKLVA